MFTVNFQSRVPVYQQIYDNVIKFVSLGILTKDSRLPTVRSLATDLGVNPNTVQKAYKMLEIDGYIYSSVGRGSFITDKLCDEAKKKESLENIRKVIKESMGNGITKTDVTKIADELFTGGDNFD